MVINDVKIKQTKEKQNYLVVSVETKSGKKFNKLVFVSDLVAINHKSSKKD